MHLRLYPDERAYLEAMGESAQPRTLAELIDLHQRWRRGELLAGVIRCEIVDAETEQPLAGAVAMLVSRSGRQIERTAPQDAA